MGKVMKVCTVYRAACHRLQPHVMWQEYVGRCMWAVDDRDFRTGGVTAYFGQVCEDVD